MRGLLGYKVEGGALVRDPGQAVFFTDEAEGPPRATPRLDELHRSLVAARVIVDDILARSDGTFFGGLIRDEVSDLIVEVLGVMVHIDVGRED